MNQSSRSKAPDCMVGHVYRGVRPDIYLGLHTLTPSNVGDAITRDVSRLL